MKRIYLDYAATTPIDKRVSKTMRDFELKFYGNPSSVHREGQDARAHIDAARAKIADFFGAKPQEIIFTSGATEANNLAIQGIVDNHYRDSQTKPHIITTLLEHSSVYNTVQELEKRGLVEATYVKPAGDNIRADDVIEAIKPNTILVSTIFVSNEIGSVLPVREIGARIKQHSGRIIFHIDAVQAVKFFNCRAEKLNCDLMTVSAHKIYGPKGSALLYVRTGVKMANLSFGGSQEYGRRPGTQNTAGIVGFAHALELLGPLEQRQSEAARLKLICDESIQNLRQIPGAMLNGPLGDDRAPDNVCFTFSGIDQDAFMTALDLAGIAASTGSACISGSTEPSHVIQALGRLTAGPAATLRLTPGRLTRAADMRRANEKITTIAKQLYKP